MQNFRAVAAIFQEAQAAVQVQDAGGFTPALRQLLASPPARQAIGGRARRVVEASRGAIDRTLDLIEPLLDTP